MPLHKGTATTLNTFFTGLIASGQLANWEVVVAGTYHAIVPPVAKGWPSIAFQRVTDDDFAIKDVVDGTTERAMSRVCFGADLGANFWFVDELDYFALITQYPTNSNAPSALWAYKSVPYTGFPGTVPDDVIHVGGMTYIYAGYAFIDSVNGYVRRGPSGEVWPDGSMQLYDDQAIHFPKDLYSPGGSRLLMPIHLRATNVYRGTAPSGIRQVMSSQEADINGRTFTDTATGTWVEFRNNDDDDVGVTDATIAFQYTGGLGYIA